MSETKSSWSFVEITPEAREAAEKAAQAAGMDIDAWLAQLIKYTSAMELKGGEPSPPAKPVAPPARPLAKPPTANSGNGAALPAKTAQPTVAATFAAAATAPTPAPPAGPTFSLSIAPVKPEAAPRGDTPPPPPFTLPNPAPRPTVSMPQRPSAPPPSLALRPAPVSGAEPPRPAATSTAPPSLAAAQSSPQKTVVPATGVVPASAATNAVAALPAAPPPPPTQGQAALAIQPAMPARPAILAPGAAAPAPATPRVDLVAKNKEAAKVAVVEEQPKAEANPEPPRPEPGRSEPRPESPRADATRMVATDMLHPSRFAALASPKEDDIQAALDKWRASGMLEPLIVRPRGGAPGQYEIISGIDRWHAARRAYVRQIPVLPREAGDQEALELGLVDQLRRAPLSPMAEANIYLRLLNDAGLDTDRAARLAGKPAAHVATMVRILNLPKPVRAMLESGEITVMHARALLDAPNPEAIARDIVEKRLDIYQTEQLVRISGRAAETVDASVLVDAPTDESIIEMGTAPFARESRPAPAAPTARRPAESAAEAPPADGEARPIPPATARRPSEARAPREGDVISTDLLERNIANTLGVRCAISERNGVGVITLHYTSREELVRILTRINGGGSAG